MSFVRNSRSTSVFALALAVLLATIDWVGLSGNFAFDDFGNIVGNVALRPGGDETHSWLAAFGSGIAGPLGRGLSMLSFAANYHFFGEDAFSFKLVNLLIHYTNALLALVLVHQTVRLLYPASDNRHTQTVAMLVAGLWALHPMNALPVVYVVQRMTSLAALFMLAGVSLYLYGRQAGNLRGHLAIAGSLLVCWPAALLSKETGVLFGVYLLLCEWLLLRSLDQLPAKVLWMAGLAGSGALLVIGWHYWGIVTDGYRVRDFDLLERLLTQARVLWFYVQQIVLPVPGSFGLYLDDFVVSRGVWDPPATAFAIAAWCGVIGLAAVHRKRWPGFTFAVGWFLGSHVLESTILPLEMVFEHRNYLASLGILTWLTHFLLTWRCGPENIKLRLAVLLLFASYCAFVTHLRASQWSDDFTRRQVEVFNHPLSARAHYEFAIGLQARTFESGQPSDAAYQHIHEHLRRATEVDPNGKVATLGLLYLDCLTHKPQDAAAFSELLHRVGTQKFSHFDRNAIQGMSAQLVNNKLCLSSADVQTLLNAGIANPHISDALRGAFYAVGMDYALVHLKDPELALLYAKAATAVAPDELAFSSNLIHILVRVGQVQAAHNEYERLSALPIAVRNPAAIIALKTLIKGEPSHAARPN